MAYVKLNSEHFIPNDFWIEHLFIEISTRPSTVKFPVFLFYVFFDVKSESEVRFIRSPLVFEL